MERVNVIDLASRRKPVAPSRISAEVALREVEGDLRAFREEAQGGVDLQRVNRALRYIALAKRRIENGEVAQ